MGGLDDLRRMVDEAVPPEMRGALDDPDTSADEETANGIKNMAAILGFHRASLETVGFTRDEALELTRTFQQAVLSGSRSEGE